MRTATYDELTELCRGITTSFVHLETRDSYGTEVESPHMAKWRRGEPDDFAWLDWWLAVLRGRRESGKTCRRARIVSEPVSDYQRWTLGHADLLVDAGEGLRYASRRNLTTTLLPGSRDFYVFDNTTTLFLHYAGSGTNAAFEITEDTSVVRNCVDAFETVWAAAVAHSEYRSK
jgi:hypothetical protein